MPRRGDNLPVTLLSRLHRLRNLAQVCAACGRRGDGRFCQRCRGASGIGEIAWRLQESEPQGCYVGVYRVHGSAMLSPVARCLHSFKDRGDRQSGAVLAAVFAECCATSLVGVHAVVPVPADPVRLRERGLSPAAWLARALGRAGGLPMITSAMARAGPGRAQRGLAGAARRTNLRSAFVPGACAVGLSLLLVDDVVTTGATLAAASRCLVAAGAARVTAAVLICADDEIIRRCRSRTGPDGTQGTAAPPRPAEPRAHRCSISRGRHPVTALPSTSLAAPGVTARD
jgi:ComF family protein